MQAQIEDGLGLLFGDSLYLPSITLRSGSSMSSHQRLDIVGRPIAGHQLFARGRRIGRGADQA